MNRINRALVAAAFVNLFLFPQINAHAQWAPLTPPTATEILSSGQFRFGAGGSYLRTTKNFDNSGSTQKLCTTCTFETWTETTFLQVGLSDAFTLYLDVQAGSSSATGTSTSGTNKITNSSAGLGDGDLGLRYAAALNPITMILEGNVLFPMYSRAPSATWQQFVSGGQVPRGNGVMRMTGMLTAEIPVLTAAESKNLLLFVAGFGYSSSTGGFSHAMPYRLQLRYEKPHVYFGRLGVVGIISADDDAYSADTSGAATARATAAIAGSNAYNAINPSVTALDVALGAYIGKNFFLSGGASAPLRGANVPRDPVFTLALGFDFGGDKLQSSYEHSNRGFQQYYLSSNVIQVNNDLGQILIDRGKNDGIRQGELLDVFEPDSAEGTPGHTVARGRAIEVGLSRTKLEIKEFFIKTRIEEGFVVRRPVH